METKGAGEDRCAFELVRILGAIVCFDGGIMMRACDVHARGGAMLGFERVAFVSNGVPCVIVVIVTIVILHDIVTVAVTGHAGRDDYRDREHNRDE